MSLSSLADDRDSPFLISIVIPCYNEAHTLLELLVRCGTISSQHTIEFIIVDNGSSDRTPNILAAVVPGLKGIKSLRLNDNAGYGGGIIAGLQLAQGHVVGWTHADLQTDPMDVLAGARYFTNLANRSFVKGTRNGRPLIDTIFTLCMSVFCSVVFTKRVNDINAQPTMFPRSLLQQFNNPPRDFSLDLYAYVLAKRNQLPIVRFKVNFKRRLAGVSHWNSNWRQKAIFIMRTIRFTFLLRKAI